MQTIKTIIGRVTKYGRKPTSEYQALRQAHDLLAEEGKWCKGELFVDGDAQEAYEKSSCGSWSACAMGAIGLVVGEIQACVVKEQDRTDKEAKVEWKAEVKNYGVENVDPFDEWLRYEAFVDYYWTEPEVPGNPNSLTAKSAVFLAEAISLSGAIASRAILADSDEDPFHIVFKANDDENTTRTMVLDWFQVAMNLARKKSK